MRWHRFAWVLAVCGLSIGCQGIYDPAFTSDGGVGPNDCPPEKLICVGDIDDGMICKCEDEVWDICVKNPGKCAPMPVPPSGGTDWECTWSEFIYKCTRGGKDSPPGGSGWTCAWSDLEQQWECVRDDVPVPPGGGEWLCQVDNETKKLVCAPKKPVGNNEWTCNADGSICTNSSEVPSGGSSWKCHKTDATTWVCYGESQTPPGGSGWQCQQMPELGQDIYKCVKKGDDLPPGGSSWTCVMGSEFGGKRCDKVPPRVPPAVGGKCKVLERAWCDGNLYCGWGQVECDPKTNTWKTKKTSTGDVILDCTEINDLRPNTVCACYFFFYNPACCERPDCIIPAGSKGQVCPKSPGKLCDYCDPRTNECTEPGGKCIVSPKKETFCGKACSASSPCPPGYTCTKVKVKVGYVTQCVPPDLSCYY